MPAVPLLRALRYYLIQNLGIFPSERVRCSVRKKHNDKLYSPDRRACVSVTSYKGDSCQSTSCRHTAIKDTRFHGAVCARKGNCLVFIS